MRNFKFLLKKASFNNLEFWLDEIKDYADGNPEIMLLGNKSDLNNLKEIDVEEAKVFLKKNFFLRVIFYFSLKKNREPVKLMV